MRYNDYLKENIQKETYAQQAGPFTRDTKDRFLMLLV